MSDLNDALGLPQEPGDMPERSSTPVIVRDYDDRWPALFEAERERILSVIGDRVVRIEHVGSTAVPGLAAKPVLDIAATIPDLADAGACVEPLGTLGYTYVAEFEKELPNRRYFHRDARPLCRTHHIHMYQEGHPEFDDFLLFRDHLRASADARRAYEDLKRDLAARVGRAEYTKGKGPFIVSTLHEARAAR